MAQLVSEKFCAQLKDHKINEIPEKLRHLSYLGSEYDHFERFRTLNEVSGLRTFLSLDLWILPRKDKISKDRYPRIFSYCLDFHLSDRICNDLLLRVQYLRVLLVSYYKITYLSDSVGNLKYLRYLDLT